MFHSPASRALTFSSSITGGWKCGLPDSRSWRSYTSSAGYTCSSMNALRRSLNSVQRSLGWKSIDPPSVATVA